MEHVLMRIVEPRAYKGIAPVLHRRTLGQLFCGIARPYSSDAPISNRNGQRPRYIAADLAREYILRSYDIVWLHAYLPA